MKNLLEQFTRERLEVIANSEGFEDSVFYPSSKGVAELARIALAVMDGKCAATPDGWLMIPSKPSREHLNSIAMRYRHDFYLLPDNQRDGAVATARQMYEECSGQGFYSIPKPE